MRTSTRRWAGGPVACAVLFAAGAAAAQVRWDAGAQVGVMQRVVAGSDVGPPGPGPVGELHVHVALVPLVRVGPYVAHDIAPEPGAPARETTEGGLRAKLTPPWLSAPWRLWAFAGVGYARVYEPSHHAPAVSFGGGAPVDVTVPGVGGGLLEVPFGVGLGYRLRRPWELFAELGARVPVIATGDVYAQPPCGCQVPRGKDAFALSLSVGVSLDQ